MKSLQKWLYTGLASALLLSACNSVSAGGPVFGPARQPAFAPVQAAANVRAASGRMTDIRNPSRIWQDEIIYFIFTDRFVNGDRNNDFNVKPQDPWAYHGGDLQGVINRLDYIRDLGTTTIWLTPVIDNRDNGFVADFGNGHKQEIWGYHGYWFKDFYKVDEHLGSMAKLQELVQKAHQRGIKVLLDIVVNHTDYDHPFAVNRANPASPHHQWFNHHGEIRDWNNQWQVENHELAQLPDLNQNNPATSKYLIDSMKWWVTQTKVDGYRIDTVKHVPRSFWKTFNREMRSFAGDDFLLLGEIYTPSAEFQAPYLHEGMHSAFDFPLYYTIKDAFGQGGSMRRFADHFAKDRLYPDASLLSPFVDNHDVPRFVHEARDRQRERLMLSMAFIMSIRGMPMLYYGTEVGLPGGADPDNRRDMDFNRDPQLMAFTKQLTAMRKQHRALRRGRQLEMWQDDQVYGFTRLTDVPNEEIMAFFNNSTQPQTRNVQVRAESPLKGSQARMVNLMNPGDVRQIANGQLQVTIPPLGFAIYRVAQ
ncbi:MAG: alpha-amlyase [Candidatus Melainabacteria bacterium HGW-Melainabacteria-1]|nr:MAG: alpha-amlyase [Candidatus Melainabacteria bacterium HGW-Melainabacteria-1]